MLHSCCRLSTGQIFSTKQLCPNPNPGSVLPFPSQLLDGRKVKSVHVAARIKLPPPSKGLQATFYMLPVTNKYGGWPASGEVRKPACVLGMRFRFFGAQARSEVAKRRSG